MIELIGPTGSLISSILWKIYFDNISQDHFAFIVSTKHHTGTIQQLHLFIQHDFLHLLGEARDTGYAHGFIAFQTVDHGALTDIGVPYQADRDGLFQTVFFGVVLDELEQIVGAHRFARAQHLLDHVGVLMKRFLEQVGSW